MNMKRKSKESLGFFSCFSSGVFTVHSSRIFAGTRSHPESQPKAVGDRNALGLRHLLQGLIDASTKPTDFFCWPTTTLSEPLQRDPLGACFPG